MVYKEKFTIEYGGAGFYYGYITDDPEFGSFAIAKSIQGVQDQIDDHIKENQ